MDQPRPDPDPSVRDVAQRRGRIWIRLAVASMIGVVAWCLWLLYPLAWVRVCVDRVASRYEVHVDLGSGRAQIVPRTKERDDRLSQWEEELANQPVARLAALLDSEDPVRVWTAAQAIQRQLRQGRRTGWPGTYGPAPPLDVACCRAILHATTAELPAVVREQLVAALATKPPETPQFRELLLGAARHAVPEVRKWAAGELLKSLKLDSTESLELLEQFCRDESSDVRRAAFNALVQAISGQPSRELPARCWAMLRDASRADDPSVRLVVARSLGHLNLDRDEAFDLAQTLVRGSDQYVRLEAVRSVVGPLPMPSTAPGSGMGPQSTPRILPARYVELVWESRISAGRAIQDSLLGCIVHATTITLERQWELVEEWLKTPSVPKGHLVESLYDSAEPAELGYQKLRARLRPLALANEARLAEWASEAIRSPDEAIAMTGVHLLTHVSRDNPNRLMPALAHASASVRYQALLNFERQHVYYVPGSDAPARWSGGLIPVCEDHIPRLVDLMSDPDLGVRALAADALNSFRGEWPSDQTERLRSLLRSDDPATRLGVVELLASRMPETRGLLEVAIELLDSNDSNVRSSAVYTLPHFGPAARGAAPGLLKGLRAGRLNSDAARVLVDLGEPFPSQDDARIVIVRLLGDPPARGVMHAGAYHQVTSLAEKLVKLCPADVLADALLDSADGAADLAKTGIADAFMQLPDPLSLLPTLTKALDGDPWTKRAAAALVLARLGKQALPAAPKLVERLADSEAPVRAAVAEALGAIGQECGAEAAAALAKMARDDPSPGGQAAAIEALGKMGRHAKPWTDMLGKLARDRELVVQHAAKRVLSDLKPNKANSPSE